MSRLDSRYGHGNVVSFTSLGRVETQERMLNGWRLELLKLRRFRPSNFDWQAAIAIVSMVNTLTTCYVVILATRHMSVAGKTTICVCLLFAIWHELAFGYLIEVISLFGI